MKLTTVLYLEPQALTASPFNPRRLFHKAPEWPDFVENIRSRGVEVPLLARTVVPAKGEAYHEIVAGHRRCAAAIEAKLATVPVLIRDLSDQQARELQAIENLQRADLSPLDEARGYENWRAQLLGDQVCKTVEDAVNYIALKVGKKRSAIFQKLSLLKAHINVKDALDSGRLDPSAAALIAGIPDPKAQARCLQENRECSVRELTKVIARDYRRRLPGAPFDQGDATLVKRIVLDADRPHGGACTDCPMRSGNTCTLPSCFEAKTQAHADRILNRAKAEKRSVIDAKHYQTHHYEYKTATDHPWQTNTPWSKLAARAKVTGSITVDKAGQRIEVFNRTQQQGILTACKIGSSSGGLSARDKAQQEKRQAKEKQFKAVAGAAIGALLGKLVAPNNPAGFTSGHVWKLMAFAAFGTIGADRVDFVAQRRGLSKSFNDSNGALEKWMKDGKRTPLEHAQLALELVVCSDWNGGGWHETAWSKEFKALCALTGKTPEQLAASTLKAPPPGPKSPPRPPRNREVGKPQPKRKGRK